MTVLVLVLMGSMAGACMSPRDTRGGPLEEARMDRFGSTKLNQQCLLLLPYRPSGRSTPTPAFAEAEAVYEQAREEYDAAGFVSAADRFVRAATLLLMRHDAPDADVASLNRSAYLYNAACAWLMAHQRDGAREDLRRLQSEGVFSEMDLKRAFDLVHPARP